MKRLLLVMTTVFTLALPIGLSTELMTALGLHTLGDHAASTLRKQYPARQLVIQELADDARFSAEQIDDWEWQALRSLNSPLPVTLPYSERWLSLDDGSDATTFSATINTGRVLEILSHRDATATGGLLVEVFDRHDRGARRVASMGPDETVLRLRASTATRYQIRVQSVPGTLGAYGLSIDKRFPLDFPVDTNAPEPVRSFFGADRDGGRRKHHGIDIFAPRHAPVVAAADGYVSRVGHSPRGGLHIWQRASDEHGSPMGALYYAHLENTMVTAGTWVERGTQIGTVGNSGNAISTPPHLHFGLYERFLGPQDPLPLTGPAQQARPTALTGHDWPEWASIDRESVNVRAGPGTQHEVLASASRGELMAVLAASDGWLRVGTGGGEVGFVAEPLLRAPPLQPLRLTTTHILKARPESTSPSLSTIAPQDLELLGRFGDARLVETDKGLRGWLIDELDSPPDEDPAS